VAQKESGSAKDRAYILLHLSFFHFQFAHAVLQRNLHNGGGTDQLLLAAQLWADSVELTGLSGNREVSAIAKVPDFFKSI
jgi:hypothetical protein